MWLLELVGITIAIGTVLGLVWRYSEDWLERRAARQQLERELFDEEEVGGIEVNQEEEATATATDTGWVRPTRLVGDQTHSTRLVGNQRPTKTN